MNMLWIWAMPWARHIEPWAVEMGALPMGVTMRGNGPSAQLGKGEGNVLTAWAIAGVVVVVSVVDIVKDVSGYL